MFWVCIIRTGDNRLYIGHTESLERRELEQRFHAHGAKFLKGQGDGFSVVYFEQFQTRAEAMRRERQLKGWTRAKKEALIEKDLERLKKLWFLNPNFFRNQIAPFVRKVGLDQNMTCHP